MDYKVITELRNDLKETVERDHKGIRCGVCTRRYPNGDVCERMYYLNGKEHGRRTCFYPNRNLMYVLHYKLGKLHGKCGWFNEDGTIACIRIYKDDKVIKTINQDETKGDLHTR